MWSEMWDLEFVYLCLCICDDLCWAVVVCFPVSSSIVFKGGEASVDGV